MHKRFEEFLLSGGVYARTGILDNKLQLPVVSFHPYTDGSMLWCILYSITEQIIGNRIQDMTVENCLVFLVERGIC